MKKQSQILSRIIADLQKMRITKKAFLKVLLSTISLECVRLFLVINFILTNYSRITKIDLDFTIFILLLLYICAVSSKRLFSNIRLNSLVGGALLYLIIIKAPNIILRIITLVFLYLH